MNCDGVKLLASEPSADRIAIIVVFWGLLFAIPIVGIVLIKRPWTVIGKRLVDALPLVASLTLLAGLVGFCMSGEVGLFGNAILALLCGTWLALIAAIISE